MTTSPVNLATPLFPEAERLTAYASGAITGKRFVKVSATLQSGPGLNTSIAGGNVTVSQATLGSHALGVAVQDKADTLLVGVLLEGVVPVYAGGTITAGDEVQSDASGKAITLAGGRALGMAVNSAVADGEVMVYLYQAAGVTSDPTGPEAHIAAPTVTGSASTPTTASLAGGNSATGTQINTAITGIIADVAALASDTADLYTSVASTNSKLNSALTALQNLGLLATS